MTTGPIVHVIDDDESARESLTFLLATADFRVRSYDSGKAFLDAVPALEAGCVITDVWMPEIGGMEIVRSLKKLKLDIPVIVITGHSDVPLAVEAMKAGAADFIEKPYDGEALLAAVRSALSTRRLDAQRDGERAQIQERLAALSRRERQVLEGLVAGHHNKTIAHELGISSRTVEIYRANVMAKMQAASLSHLVRMALIAA